MKKTITFLALCLIGTLSFAQQAPAIQWQKCFGGYLYDYATSIQPTTDGGYIVAGYTNSVNGDIDYQPFINSKAYWVVKISATGAIEWQKSLGGVGDDYAYSIQPTSDGGYVVAGATVSIDGDVTGNHGGNDAWIVKLSATGAIEWQKALGGTGDDLAYCIQNTLDGGYIVAGLTTSTDGDVTGNHGIDAWVVKLSTTGALVWQKCLGGTGRDWVNSIQPTPDGGYIVAGAAGSTDGDVTGNHGGYDYWVVKLGATGTIEWQKALGGTGLDEASSINYTPDGGYIVTGLSKSTNGDVTGNHGGGDAWVVKLAATGALQWQKCLGGTGIDQARSIQPTPDGGYILAGHAYSTNGDVTVNHGYIDAWLVKLGATGALVWQKCFGGSNDDQFFSIQLTPDGGYVMAGYTDSGGVPGFHSSTEYWVVKLGPELAKSTFNNQVLTLYPNPTNGLLQLQTPNNTIFNKIIITDSTGKIVLEQTQNTTQVDVEQLASGLYIIKAFSGEEVFVNKFVKE